MENNQIPMPPHRPPRKQMAPKDMFILAMVILVITRINWTNLNSFHFLLLFLMGLMLMLRWGNMRKDAVRKDVQERYKAQFEAEEAAARDALELAELLKKKAAAEAGNVEETDAPAEPVVAAEVSEKTEE